MQGTPWREITVPDDVRRIPNMLTPEEQQYLIWLAATASSGAGAVIDLGPWVGCSSAALAAGLRMGGGNGIVRAFDLFEWRPDYMEHYLRTGLADGDDFLPVFAEQTMAYADRIVGQRMDLFDATWSGGPIELLFVDAAKTWGLTNAILRTFAPSLIPGHSLVVLQDFKHMPTWWLPLVFGSRPDLWEELHDLADGDTATFRLRAPLDAAAGAAAAYSIESFTPAQVRRIHDHRQRRPGGPRIRMSCYRAMLHYFGKGEADAWLADAMPAGDEAERRARANAVEAAVAGWRAEGMAPIWRALEAGDDATAERLVLALGEPPTAQGEVVLGRVAQRRGEHRQAVLHFARAGADTTALLFAATSWNELGEPATAIHSMQALLDRTASLRHDQRRWALHALREAWLRRGDVERARHECQDLLQKFPDDPDVLVLAALVDRYEGRVDSARQRLQRALELQPRHAEARVLFEGG